ncbi:MULTISPECIES: hypothetical protein [Streptomyces]|uniref:hypothetical protein n=1 Tax=Streptomyces TaxID=1883 RepID=UPI000A74570E|nr:MULTISPECIES: hypothetical protein [Streptomyces]MCO8308418.1 hypothetical protein [Streptomyces sp. RKCA744]
MSVSMSHGVRTVVTSFAIAAAITVGAPLAGVHADSVAVRTYSATVKCAKVRISDNHGTGFVYGHGKGRTKPSAVKDAKKDANERVGRGYRAKHCRTVSAS